MISSSRSRRLFVSLSAGAVALACAACGSSDQPAQAGGTAHDAGGFHDSSPAPTLEAGPMQVVEHGVIYDYGSVLGGQMSVVRGLTISDGTQTATSDAQGKFEMTQPLGVPINGSISGTSGTGDTYATLLLPEVIFTNDQGDRGQSILPDMNTLNLENTILAPDPTKATVNILVLLTGSCASAEGATIKVNAPSGVNVRYIDSLGYPRQALTAIAALSSPWRAAAALWNVEPGQPLDLELTHPTCKQMPFPATVNGTQFTGKVVTKPVAGNVTSAIVLVLGDADADAGAPSADAAAE